MKRIDGKALSTGLIVAMAGMIAIMAPGIASAEEEESGRPPKPVEIVNPLPVPVDIDQAGAPDVNVVNTPTVELRAGTSVQVGNDQENPVPVLMMASPPPTDFHISNDYFIKCTEGAGGNPALGCFGGRDEINCATNRCPIYTVPDDYYLVIEQINVHRDDEIGNDAYISVEVYTRLDRRTGGELWGPVYHRYPIGPKVVNHPVTIYAGNGTDVNVDLRDETVTGDDRYVRISWTGQLVPAPRP